MPDRKRLALALLIAVFALVVLVLAAGVLIFLLEFVSNLIGKDLFWKLAAGACITFFTWIAYMALE